MAYIQKNHPFPITSCGRRRSFMTTEDRIELFDTPNKKLRKTTKGKGRHFLSTKEGAGMTEAGRRAYKKENPGSTLSAPVTGKVKPGSKAAKRRKSFCARSRNWTSKRGKAARRRWKC